MIQHTLPPWCRHVVSDTQVTYIVRYSSNRDGGGILVVDNQSGRWKRVRIHPQMLSWKDFGFVRAGWTNKEVHFMSQHGDMRSLPRNTFDIPKSFGIAHMEMSLRHIQPLLINHPHLAKTHRITTSTRVSLGDIGKTVRTWVRDRLLTGERRGWNFFDRWNGQTAVPDHVMPDRIMLNGTSYCPRPGDPIKDACIACDGLTVSILYDTALVILDL